MTRYWATCYLECRRCGGYERGNVGLGKKDWKKIGDGEIVIGVVCRGCREILLRDEKRLP